MSDCRRLSLSVVSLCSAFSSFANKKSSPRLGVLLTGLVALAFLLLPADAHAQVTYAGTLGALITFDGSSGDTLSPIAVDGAGDVFYVVQDGNSGANTLYEIPFGGSQTAKNTNLPFFPSAIAVNNAGTALYFLYYGTASLCTGGSTSLPVVAVLNSPFTATPSDLSQTFTFSTYCVGYTDATGLAVNPTNGDLYIADFGGGAIYKLNGPVTSSSKPASFIFLYVQPYDIAVNGNGTIYFTYESTTQAIASVPASSFSSTIPANGVSASIIVNNIPNIQSGLAVGPSPTNTIYLGGTPVDVVSGSSLVAVNSGLSNGTTGLGVASNGQLYIGGYDSDSNLDIVGNSTQPYFNFGSEAVNSTTAVQSLNFTINAGTTVGSIGILTTGIANLDFLDGGSTTCTATAYSSNTNCVVSVKFKPLATGLRRGAVVFYSGANLTGTQQAIVQIYGTGTGPQAAFGPAGNINVGSGFTTPLGYAVDAAGNVFVADNGAGKVNKVTPGGTLTTVTGLIANPHGVAVDGAGYLYVADSSTTVYKVAPDGTKTTVNSTFASPYGIALDGQDNFYVSDHSAGKVYKVTPGGTKTTVYTGLSSPEGVAVDAAGNVYVANNGGGEVYMMTPGGTQSTVVSGLTSPDGVSVDGAGTVYISDDSAHVVYQVPSGGSKTTVATVTSGGFGLAIDGSGNLYTSGPTPGPVIELGRATPPPVNFPTVTPAHAVDSVDGTMIVEMENIGTTSLDISSVNFPTDFINNTSGTDACGSTLDVSALCNINIEFQPQSANPSGFTEYVTINDDSLNLTSASQSITVTGASKVAPVLSVTKTHTGTYTQGSTALWNISVSNAAASGATSGTTNVSDTLPAGYTLASYSGTGWTCSGTTTISCSSTQTISGGSSFPQIQLTVNVPANSPTSVINTAYSYGGGSATQTDLGNAASGTDNVTVVQVPATITINSGGSQLTQISTAFATPLAVTVKDAGGVAVPNSTVTFTAPASGASGTFSNSSYTITATTNASGVATAGIFTANSTIGGPYSVNATDSTATAASFSLTNAQAPAITTASSTTFTVGVAGSFTVTTTGAPAPAISKTGALPSGVTFTDNGNGTATLSGTPASGTSGSYPITITAQNGASPNATQSFTLTVQLPQVQITTAANPAAGGTVTPVSGNLYSQGTSVPLMATPNTGYTFMNWTSSPGSVANPTSASTTITMNAAETVTANFTPTLVVYTANDDSGLATNCTPQATPGSNTVDAACSLRDALLFSANAGSANISFDSTKFAATNTALQNTINLTNSTLNIPANTSITGATSGSGATLTNLVTVAGGGSSSNFSVFTVGSGVTGAAINNLTITNGNTSGSGGGINNSGTLTVRNSTVYGNSAQNDYGGGGIFNIGTLTLSGSTVSGNSVGNSYGGGGIFNYGTGMTVSNSTIYGNSTTSSYGGGGIYNYGSALTVTNSTIYGNFTSGSYGGGILNYLSTLTLANSIVDGNWLGSSSSVSNYDDLDDGSSNTSFTSSSSNNGGDVVGLYNNPQATVPTPVVSLARMGNYGGPTQTMLPQPDSPAICAGSKVNATTAGLTGDQRGFGFVSTYCPSGFVDAGAVQTNYALSFTTEPGASQVAWVPFTAAVTLTENASPVSGVTIPLTLNGGGTLSGGSATTNSSGMASYTLTVASSTALPGLTLTATLPSPPALTPKSTSFNLSAPPPTVTGIYPSNGPPAGGTTLTITGTNFTGATAVKFGSTPVINFIVINATQITATSPTEVAGVVDVTVTTPGGTSATSPADQFTYSKITVTVTLGGLSQTYTGSPLSATATTTPANLTVNFTYNGQTAPPTAAGTYTVVGTINDSNYQGTATGTLTINPANATINVTPYTVTYDGNPHTATGTALGVGGINLAANLTLNGTTHTNAGTYATDSWSFTDTTGNYASTSGTVSDKINQASQTISFPLGINPSSPAVTTYAYSLGGTFTLRASTNSGLAVSFASITPTVCSVTGATAYILTAGTCTVQATQSGSTNYSAATPVPAYFTITQVTPTITQVSSLNPILLQNPVTYTATVSSVAGNPTGTVTFSDGGTAITACASAAVNVSNGQSNCAVTYTVTGTHNITAVYNGDTNYLAAGPSNTVSEAAIDISLGAALSGTETILPGATATYTFPIAPSSGTTFPSPVTFTVSSSPALPTGTTMTLTPSAWIFTSNNPWSWTLPASTSLTSNTVLTIQVPQNTASAQPAGGNLVPRLAPFSLALLLLPFAGRLRKSGKRLGRMLAIILLAGAGAATLAGLSGCGSNTGFFAQKQQSYTVTVTVASGSLSHTSTVNLTVE